MEGIASIGVALAAFAAINIDDLLLVSACFADPSVRRRDIVLGQFLGIGLLVAASARAAVAALVIPEGWTAPLGAIPLGLGSQRWWTTRGESSPAREHAREPRARSQWLSIAAVTVANGGDNLAVYIPLFASSPRMIPVTPRSSRS